MKFLSLILVKFYSFFGYTDMKLPYMYLLQQMLQVISVKNTMYSYHIHNFSKDSFISQTASNVTHLK